MMIQRLLDSLNLDTFHWRIHAGSLQESLRKAQDTVKPSSQVSISGAFLGQMGNNPTESSLLLSTSYRAWRIYTAPPLSYAFVQNTHIYIYRVSPIQ